MLEVGVCFPLAMPLGVCFEARIDVGVCLHLFLFAEVKFLCSRVENHGTADISGWRGRVMNIV